MIIGRMLPIINVVVSFSPVFFFPKEKDCGRQIAPFDRRSVSLDFAGITATRL
jgi:hypothetical protein